MVIQSFLSKAWAVFTLRCSRYILPFQRVWCLPSLPLLCSGCCSCSIVSCCIADAMQLALFHALQSPYVAFMFNHAMA